MVLDEVGSMSDPEKASTPVDSKSSSSFASNPVVTDSSSVPKASIP